MKTEHHGPESGSSSWLRYAGLSAVLVGAVGSLGLFFHASQHPPLLLIVLFMIWILSPFVMLGTVHMISKRWSNLTRTTLYIMMLVVALGTLAVYGDDALNRRTVHAAAVYVLAPPVSVVIAVIALSMTAVISGRRSRRMT